MDRQTYDFVTTVLGHLNLLAKCRPSVKIDFRLAANLFQILDRDKDFLLRAMPNLYDIVRYGDFKDFKTEADWSWVYAARDTLKGWLQVPNKTHGNPELYLEDMAAHEIPHMLNLIESWIDPPTAREPYRRNVRDRASRAKCTVECPALSTITGMIIDRGLNGCSILLERVKCVNIAAQTREYTIQTAAGESVWTYGQSFACTIEQNGEVAEGLELCWLSPPMRRTSIPAGDIDEWTEVGFKGSFTQP